MYLCFFLVHNYNTIIVIFLPIEMIKRTIRRKVVALVKAYQNVALKTVGRHNYFGQRQIDVKSLLNVKTF